MFYTLNKCFLQIIDYWIYECRDPAEHCSRSMCNVKQVSIQILLKYFRLEIREDVDCLHSVCDGRPDQSPDNRSPGVPLRLSEVGNRKQSDEGLDRTKTRNTPRTSAQFWRTSNGSEFRESTNSSVDRVSDHLHLQNLDNLLGGDGSTNLV